MTNPFLMTDFYKLCHMMQFRENIVGFTSYLVPRGNRTRTFKGWTIFGVQAFVNQLHITFRDNFFGREWPAVANEIASVLIGGLGYKQALIEKTLEKIEKLHKLGYLPIIIKAIPEGTEVPIGCPAVEISTTSKEVPWIGQAIESWLSCAIWHPSMSATVGKAYAKLCKKAYDRTVDGADYHRACADFSMRGQESYESAVASAAGWLTAMYNSSTVGAKDYIFRNYEYEDADTELPIGGLTSTEHSVMCSDFAIGGDERETYRRLLAEVYPDVSFAAVCDSYDFWRVLTEVLPSLRDEIEAHEGFLGVRYDSAEPVTALCGIEMLYMNVNDVQLKEDMDIKDVTTEDLEDALFGYAEDFVMDEAWEYFRDEISMKGVYANDTFEFRLALQGRDGKVLLDKVYIFKMEIYSERGRLTDCDYPCIGGVSIDGVRNTSYEDKGMVETMYELFGGTTNSKGFKLMNPKLKAVYGDSITLQRAEEIFNMLEWKGFAANNVSLGVGSFSMECIEENGRLKPFTRDTFSIAIKATYGEVEENGEIRGIPIFKNPKNFSQKRSLKGLAIPYLDESGAITFKDELSREDYEKLSEKSLMREYYRDGGINFDMFSEVRKRVDMEVNA